MLYVYRHIRLDRNQPFYIGVGNNLKNNNYERAFSKERPNSKIWNYIVSKSDYEVEILMEFDNNESALEKEKELIKFYGRINNNNGILANMTDGGEGVLGRVVTDESRERYSLASKNKPKPSEESKLKNRIAHLGKKASVETIEKLRGKKQSERQKEWIKRHSNSQENIRRLVARNKTVTSDSFTKEHRRKISDSKKGVPKPEYLKKKWSIQRSVKPVNQYDIDGNFLKEWISAAEIERELGYDPSNIFRSCTIRINVKRNRKQRTAYGYKWAYKTID